MNTSEDILKNDTFRSLERGLDKRLLSFRPARSSHKIPPFE
jgi:hypothetical protein